MWHIPSEAYTEAPGGSESGVIIVPDDCQANPDATSRQPCLNYSKLIIP
ncbi:MAG TPA: hypothetical protein VGK74_07795 [Symbiobacteriaceae bacterium]